MEVIWFVDIRRNCENRGMKDVPHLRRSEIMQIGYPARQRTAGWANLCRAYGAGLCAGKIAPRSMSTFEKA